MSERAQGGLIGLALLVLLVLAIAVVVGFIKSAFGKTGLYVSLGLLVAAIILPIVGDWIKGDMSNREVKEFVLTLLMFPGMAGMIAGPVMIMWPLFVATQWYTAGTIFAEAPPSTFEWMVSPLVSLGGIIITYAVFRGAAELDRDVDGSDCLTDEYLDALEDGEVSGFIYLCKKLASPKLAWKALRYRTPEAVRRAEDE